MKSIFLSPDALQALQPLEYVGAAAPAADLVRLTQADDGFFTDGHCVNYWADGEAISRFGRVDA